MENGDHESVEITMTPKKVYDDKPVPMAAAILSNSKLHFLKFIYEVVYKYFIPNSFKLCYADTDSIAIGKVVKISNIKLNFEFKRSLKQKSRMMAAVDLIWRLFYYQLLNRI